jgi:hypothetical protein
MKNIFDSTSKTTKAYILTFQILAI